MTPANASLPPKVVEAVAKWTLSGRYRRKDDIFYIRLPDPSDGSLDVQRFMKEGYPYDMIFEGIVNLAEYDETTVRTKFINVRPTDGPLPSHLIWEDDYDTDADVLDLVADAVTDSALAVDEQRYFGRNTNGEQLLFASFPTFKSHVAIVMIVEDYD